MNPIFRRLRSVRSIVDMLAEELLVGTATILGNAFAIEASVVDVGFRIRSSKLTRSAKLEHLPELPQLRVSTF